MNTSQRASSAFGSRHLNQRIGPRGWNYRFKRVWLDEYLESCIVETSTQARTTKVKTPKPKKRKATITNNPDSGFRKQLLEECKSGNLG
ncbi:hypothetical protein LOC67_20320 [Stieleria sp. JC731]|uniref:hypothetical protein n=1 Tax=Pirellulaceae TaxID=2691357 RepID=UPI001E37C97C|nr:hypothetical protein [Stieleria sp. JC731]MCC9602902.1 hypothetical protein [Stieleria sp. JC731]